MLVFDIAYMCTKFDHSSFSHSRDVIGAHQNLNDSRDLITPLSGMICHPWASTCYDHPAYQIWNLYTTNIWKGIQNVENKLAPYGTDGRLFTTDVSAKFKVTLHKN